MNFKQTGIRWRLFLHSNHPLLNGIKETVTRWGVFLNSNHSQLNGFKHTGTRKGQSCTRWGVFVNSKPFPIEWNRGDMHMIGSFSEFKSSPIERNQTNRHTIGSFSQFVLPFSIQFVFVVLRAESYFSRISAVKFQVCGKSISRTQNDTDRAITFDERWMKNIFLKLWKILQKTIENVCQRRLIENFKENFTVYVNCR